MNAWRALLSDPKFIILHVKSPAASAAFHARLLGRPLTDSASNFAIFALTSGVMLGLWAAHDVMPPATPTAGAEVAFALDSRQAVDDCLVRWPGLGLVPIQAPIEMDFGYTFTAQDPHRHRLRVFAPHAGRPQRAAQGRSTLGTAFGRSLKVSGNPDPNSGRRYMRKASVTSVPLALMN